MVAELVDALQLSSMAFDLEHAEGHSKQSEARNFLELLFDAMDECASQLLSQRSVDEVRTWYCIVFVSLALHLCGLVSQSMMLLLETVLQPAMRQ
jgi:hypothetical protein